MIMIKREGECPIVLCTAVACMGVRSMTFTTCGVIVGSRILVVTRRACHLVGSCVNCEKDHTL